MNKILSFIEKYKMQLATIFIAALLIDAFMLQFINDLVVLFLLSYWIFISWLYGWQSRFIVLLGIIMLLPSALFFIIKVPAIAEKFSLWAYIFFTTAVFKEILIRIKEKWLKKE